MSIASVATKIEPAIALAIFAQELTGVGRIAAKDALLVMDAVAKRFGEPMPAMTMEQARAEVDKLRAAFAADDAAADALVDEHA